MTATYQDVAQMVSDGISAEEIEVVLADERTALTAEQIEDLRADLAARDDDMNNAPNMFAAKLLLSRQRKDVLVDLVLDLIAQDGQESCDAVITPERVLRHLRPVLDARGLPRSTGALAPAVHPASMETP